MSDLRNAARQALAAMEDLHRTGDTQVFDLCHRETTEALRAALEQPEQEPLSDEELDRLWREPMSADWEHREYARAVEAAHGIKEQEP
jgi:hypothetical protein